MRVQNNCIFVELPPRWANKGFALKLDWVRDFSLEKLQRMSWSFGKACALSVICQCWEDDTKLNALREKCGECFILSCVGIKKTTLGISEQ